MAFKTRLHRWMDIFAINLCVLRAAAQMQPLAQRVPELPEGGWYIRVLVYIHFEASYTHQLLIIYNKYIMV